MSSVKPSLEDRIVFLLITLDLPTHSFEAAEARLKAIANDRESIWLLMQDVDCCRVEVKDAIDRYLAAIKPASRILP